MSVSRRLGRTTVHTSHPRASLVPIDGNSTPNDHRRHHHSPRGATAAADDDDDDAISASPPRRTPLTVPARDDCWTEEATSTLIDVWGDRYVKLRRGNLSQKHWLEVARAVNSRHGFTTKKSRRSDTQCRNRIDTLKKRYKNEKSKIKASKVHYTPSWPFFHRLDSLIGTSTATSPAPSKSHSQALRRKTFPALFSPTLFVPVGRRSKRPTPAINTHSRRNFSMNPSSESDTSAGIYERRDLEVGVDMNAYRELAEAIVRFGEIYERVEEDRCRQMIDLEKERMKLAQDLEIERIKIFIDSQVQLHNLTDPISITDAHQRSPDESNQQAEVDQMGR